MTSIVDCLGKQAASLHAVGSKLVLFIALAKAPVHLLCVTCELQQQGVGPHMYLLSYHEAGNISGKWSHTLL
jgi:hypothetical protein